MIDRTGEIRSTRAPTLREDQMEILRRYGQKRKMEVGDVLFRAGDTQNDFIIILEGQVEVVDDFAGGARTIGVFLAGRFLGELNMLTGQAMYLTAVVREGGEVLAITRERLKEIVTEEPNLSDVILKAFLARRTYMIRTGLGLRIIGSRHSSDATRLREVAARNRVPHVWEQLGGPGSAVPGGTHKEGLPAHKGRGSRQEHVEVPRRPDYERREHRAAGQHRGERAHGRGSLEGGRDRGQPLGGTGPLGRGRSLSSSARRPTPAGSKVPSNWTSAASS